MPTPALYATKSKPGSDRLLGRRGEPTAASRAGAPSNNNTRRPRAPPGSLGHGGRESIADDGQCGAAGEAAGGDHGAEVGVDLGAPFRAKPVRHSAEDHRGPQRPLLSLTVASTSRRVRNTSSLSRAVTAMVARRWLPSTSVGVRSSRRSNSRSRRRRCVAIVRSARSGRRCPTAQASFKNALNCGAKIVSP